MRYRDHAVRNLPPTVPQTIITTRMLRGAGFDHRALAAEVALGRIIRVRRGKFLPGGSHPVVVRAAELGTRVDCISLLRLCGVFVWESPRLHVQAAHGASRLPARPRDVVCHWRSAPADDGVLADLIDALVQSIRCHSPRAAIATLDSAWHLGLVSARDIDEVFDRLPRRFQPLRGLLDPRGESGPESLVRLMLRILGCSFDLQVTISGVGRVDFVVEDWLIIECDSEAHHSSWAARKRDARRDLVAAGLGYASIRLMAEDILYRPDDVQNALREILTSPARRPRRQP
ncbi:MAG: DUF559 domain-containing protein [Microbacterium sp.]|nr:DUF559 domain-containing protein [Microbacterium sp.]MBN9174000.1 DUF559 domain-containing protein [Microbacterium sp.]MBN9183409.1 DUF559 domain-containing protein [Microbacterium sp.]